MHPSYHDMAYQADQRRADLLQEAARHEQVQQHPATRTGPGPLDNALGKLGNVMVSVGEGLQARADTTGTIATDPPNLNQQCC